MPVQITGDGKVKIQDEGKVQIVAECPTPVYAVEYWGSRGYTNAVGGECAVYGTAPFFIQYQEGDTCDVVCGSMSEAAVYAHAQADVGAWGIPFPTCQGPCRVQIDPCNNDAPTGAPTEPPNAPTLGTYRATRTSSCPCPPPNEGIDGYRSFAYLATVKLIFKLSDPSGFAVARWQARYYSQSRPLGVGVWDEPVLLSTIDDKQKFSVPTEDYAPENLFDSRLCVTDLIPFIDPPASTASCDTGQNSAEAVWMRLSCCP